MGVFITFGYLITAGTNAAMGGLSAQPVFGGPAYYIRNTMYHIPRGVSLKFGGKPAGLFVYHNTIICENLIGGTAANMHFRNNLILGRDEPNRGIMSIGNSHSINSSDFNGYRPNKGVEDQYKWFAPPPGEVNYRPGRGDWKRSTTLEEFQAATGQEAHSIEVDYDIFRRAEAAGSKESLQSLPRHGSESTAQAG